MKEVDPNSNRLSLARTSPFDFAKIRKHRQIFNE